MHFATPPTVCHRQTDRLQAGFSASLNAKRAPDRHFHTFPAKECLAISLLFIQKELCNSPFAVFNFIDDLSEEARLSRMGGLRPPFRFNKTCRVIYEDIFDIQQESVAPQGPAFPSSGKSREKRCQREVSFHLPLESLRL